MTYKVTVDILDETFDNTFTSASDARSFINDIEYSKILSRVSNNPVIIIPTNQVLEVRYEGDFTALCRQADDEDTARWKEQRVKDKAGEETGLTLTEVKM